MSATIDTPYGRAPLIAHGSREEDDFVLYQPDPRKQMLFYDLATSLSVLSYLRMKNMSASIRSSTNAEFMENGRMPIVYERSSEKLMSGFTELYWHLARKLDETPSILELSYMDWVETKFLEAEMYICWCNESFIELFTKSRYTYDLPWPIASILFSRKRSQMELSIKNKFESIEDVIEKFNRFLVKLNKRIGNKPYCLSETTPSCVDALIYGHTEALFKTKELLEFTGMPSTHAIFLMVDAITKQRRIVNLKELISKNYPS